MEKFTEFLDYKNTLSMFYTVQQALGKKADVEINNCYYDEKSLIQSLSTENETSCNIVLVKRKIKDEKSTLVNSIIGVCKELVVSESFQESNEILAFFVGQFKRNNFFSFPWMWMSS